jgi:hypothetical protein
VQRSCRPRTRARRVRGSETASTPRQSGDGRGADAPNFTTLRGTDLNDDGDADDLVIQIYDVPSGTVRTIGTVTQGNPLGGGDPGTTNGTVYISTGACIEVGGSCTLTTRLREDDDRARLVRG